MAFMMRINFVDVICDDSLVSTYADGKKNGYSFDIRLSYYRGHFLSDIDRFEVYTDGEKVADRDIQFGLNGKQFTVGQLGQCVSEFWTLLEPAHISVIRPGGLPAGEHDIKVVLYLRCPYLPLPGSAEGEHKYQPIDGCGEKKLTIA